MKRTPGWLIRMGLAVSLASCVPGTEDAGSDETRAAAPATVAKGRAEGSFVVDGKPLALAHAYARFYGDGADETEVLLTEKPLPERALTGTLTLWEVQRAQGARGLRFVVTAKGRPQEWQWDHPLLAIGCYFCSNLRHEVAKGEDHAVAGSVYSEKPQTFDQHTYEFRAAFHADRRPSPAQVASANLVADPATLKAVFRGVVDEIVQLEIDREWATVTAKAPQDPKAFVTYSYRDRAVLGPTPVEGALCGGRTFRLADVDFALLPQMLEDAPGRQGVSGPAPGFNAIRCRKGWMIRFAKGVISHTSAYWLDGKPASEWTVTN